MQTECVQEALQHVHAKDDTERDRGEDGEPKENREGVAHLDGGEHRLLPEHGC